MRNFHFFFLSGIFKTVPFFPTFSDAMVIIEIFHEGARILNFPIGAVLASSYESTGANVGNFFNLKTVQLNRKQGLQKLCLIN